MAERSGDRDRMEGTVDEMKGRAKQAWGDITDDQRMKGEGMVDEAEGRARQAMGDIKDKIEDVREDVAERTSR